MWIFSSSSWKLINLYMICACLDIEQLPLALLGACFWIQGRFHQLACQDAGSGLSTFVSGKERAGSSQC